MIYWHLAIQNVNFLNTERMSYWYRTMHMRPRTMLILSDWKYSRCLGGFYFADIETERWSTSDSEFGKKLERARRAQNRYAFARRFEPFGEGKSTIWACLHPWRGAKSACASFPLHLPIHSHLWETAEAPRFAREQDFLGRWARDECSPKNPPRRSTGGEHFLVTLFTFFP